MVKRLLVSTVAGGGGGNAAEVHVRPPTGVRLTRVRARSVGGGLWPSERDAARDRHAALKLKAHARLVASVHCDVGQRPEHLRQRAACAASASSAAASSGCHFDLRGLRPPAFAPALARSLEHRPGRTLRNERSGRLRAR